MQIWIFCTVIAIAVLASASIIWVYRKRTERLLGSMSRMLDLAENGSFSETFFDESLVSAIETKLAHFISANEVSQRKLKEEKDKIKELISDISHQTKTPIANILLYAQLLGEQQLPEKDRQCIEQLNEQAEKLDFLVRQLIRSSWMETGILTPNPTQQDVMPMLQDAVRQIHSRAEMKNISISGAGVPAGDMLMQDAAVTAEFDAKWTVEAIFNILDNGVKYTPNGGSVRIRVISYEMFCRIDIGDTGMGISEDEQSQIFKRFYRSPAASQVEGLGIGLFLARQIIAAQGGYIKVSSKPGKGAVFSVFLPIKPEILQNCHI